MLFSPLCSGSSGNASYLEAGGARLLIDAGLPASRITALLEDIDVEPKTLRGILITHEHTDHIAGAGVLSRRFDLPVYATAGCWAHMRQALGEIKPRNIRVIEPGQAFFIHELSVLPFPTPHDAAESVGYAISDGIAKLTVMTDIGCFTDDLLAAAAGSGLLMIESNHDEDMLKAGAYPYPLKRRILGREGHLSNECCAEALIRLYGTGVRRAVLAHLSEDNNIEALAVETVRQALRAADISDEDFFIGLARGDEAGEVFEL